jgi:uncharacterized protein YdaU (DUF1376 family)
MAAAMRNPPAFQLYASDLLASEEFKVASLEERGLALTMMMQCWVSDSVPGNPPDLAKVLGVEVAEIARTLTPRVLAFFEEHNSRLIRHELAEQKADMLKRRQEQSAAGKKGANHRWKTKKKKMAYPMGSLSETPLGWPEKRRVDMGRGEVSRDLRINNIDYSQTNEEEIRKMKEAFGEST